MDHSGYLTGINKDGRDKTNNRAGYLAGIKGKDRIEKVFIPFIPCIPV
jgi:hypothetical protein